MARKSKRLSKARLAQLKRIRKAAGIGEFKKMSKAKAKKRRGTRKKSVQRFRQVPSRNPNPFIIR